MPSFSSYSSAADIATGATIGIIGIIFVVLLIVLLISLIPAIVCAKVASNKGYSGIGYFFLTFFFGIFGVLLVVALPDRKVQRLLEQIANNTAQPIQNVYTAPPAPNTFSEAVPQTAVIPEPITEEPSAPVVSEVQGPQICPNCNQEVLKDAKFCRNCGAKLQ